MKLTVLQDNLNRALTVAMRGVSSRPQLPVLSSILIRATKSGLVVVGTDLEFSFTIKVGAKVEKEGEILVPAKLMGELVASLPAGAVELILEKQVLKVKIGGVEAEVQGQAAEEFPEVPEYKGRGIVLEAREFKRKINRVGIAAARDGVRPVYEGVLWMFEADKILLATTDGYRLGLDKLKGIKKEMLAGFKGKKYILPIRSLMELVRVLGEEGSLEIGFEKEKQQVVFRWAEIEMVSQLIGGEFPDFDQIMPDDFKTRLVVERDDLEAAVRRASIFARSNANVVRLKIGKRGVEVSATSADSGKNVSSLEAQVEGEALEVSFNGKYLLDYLGVVDEERVVFETEGEMKPGVLKVESDEFLYIVMPIRQES